MILPKAPPARLLDKTAMPSIADRYQAIYIANGEQIGPSPYVLRPHADWAPVICSVGTTHAGAQWQSLLVALASGAVRATDGFIFKSRAAQSAVPAGLGGLGRAGCGWRRRFPRRRR